MSGSVRPDIQPDITGFPPLGGTRNVRVSLSGPDASPEQSAPRLSRAARAAVWAAHEARWTAWHQAGAVGDAPQIDEIPGGTQALDHAFAACMRSGQRERWR